MEEGLPKDPISTENASTALSRPAARARKMREISLKNMGSPVFSFNAGHAQRAKLLLGDNLIEAPIKYEDNGQQETEETGYVVVHNLRRLLGTNPTSEQRSRFLALIDAELTVLPGQAEVSTDEHKAGFYDRQLRKHKENRIGKAPRLLRPFARWWPARVERTIKRQIRDIRKKNPPQDVLDYCLSQLSAAQAIVTELQTPRLRDTVANLAAQTHQRLHIKPKMA